MFTFRSNRNIILFFLVSPLLHAFGTYTKLALDPFSLALSGGAYGTGAGPIYLKGMLCQGNEGNLTQCRTYDNFDSDYYACSHSDDAAVICPREEHLHVKIGFHTHTIVYVKKIPSVAESVSCTTINHWFPFGQLLFS